MVKPPCVAVWERQETRKQDQHCQVVRSAMGTSQCKDRMGKRGLEKSLPGS